MAQNPSGMSFVVEFADHAITKVFSTQMPWVFRENTFWMRPHVRMAECTRKSLRTCPREEYSCPRWHPMGVSSTDVFRRFTPSPNWLLGESLLCLLRMYSPDGQFDARVDEENFSWSEVDDAIQQIPSAVATETILTDEGDINHRTLDLVLLSCRFTRTVVLSFYAHCCDHRMTHPCLTRVCLA